MRKSHRFGMLLAGMVGLVSGCGSEASDTPMTDSGSPDSATTETAGDVRVDVATDSAVADTTASDAIGDVAPIETTSTVVKLSETTHDRFFGVAFDKTGSFYATGVMGETGGTDGDLAMIVAKFKSDGTLDLTFGTKGVAKKNVIAKKNGEIARGIVVQSTGKIVIAGAVEHLGAAGETVDDRDRDIALVRFNTNGTVDETFGTAGVVILDLSPGEVSGTSYVADSQWGLDLFPGDGLLVTGAQKAPGRTDTDFAVIKLKADGARDESFGNKGVATVDIDNLPASPRSGYALADGSIVGSGYMKDKDSIVRPVVFKLKSDGTLDNTFGNKGVFNEVVLPSATEIYGLGFQGTNIVTVGYGRAAPTESNDLLSLRLSAAGVLDKTYGNVAGVGVGRLDVAGQNENGRAIVVLPDQRVMMIGAGRPTATNADGLVALLTKDGKPDTSFGTGFKLFDFGGPNDHLWAGALSPSKDRIVLVGTRGVDTAGTGNDDAAIVMIPVPK